MFETGPHCVVAGVVLVQWVYFSNRFFCVWKTAFHSGASEVKKQISDCGEQRAHRTLASDRSTTEIYMLIENSSIHRWLCMINISFYEINKRRRAPNTRTRVKDKHPKKTHSFFFLCEAREFIATLCRMQIIRTRIHLQINKIFV